MFWPLSSFPKRTNSPHNHIDNATPDCYSLFNVCYASADATKMPTTHYDNNVFCCFS